MSVGDYTEEELGLQDIKIDKEVPLRERYPRHAFTEIAKKMEVGDSVFTKDPRVINGINNALNKLGCSATTRSEGEGKRLWRVK